MPYFDELVVFFISEFHFHKFESLFIFTTPQSVLTIQKIKQTVTEKDMRKKR